MNLGAFISVSTVKQEIKFNCYPYYGIINNIYTEYFFSL